MLHINNNNNNNKDSVLTADNMQIVSANLELCCVVNYNRSHTRLIYVCRDLIEYILSSEEDDKTGGLRFCTRGGGGYQGNCAYVI